MSTTSRIYIITQADKWRLVRASHPAQALTHVAKDLLTVRVASQDDIVNALALGAKVEDAKAD
jgi:hypothetical protein